jgi:trans-2,3-dihydro-3-hydroxyanthranilate isomerase
MTRIRYHLVDVFTDRQFGGNQLAVISDARGLSGELMQAIAREFNLAETTFVLPPENAAHHFKVRIFTPGREMLMAGHPTVGTAYVLARLGLIEVAGQEANVVFEEGIGPIPVSLHLRDGTPEVIYMTQPLPRFGPRHPDPAAVAEILSLPSEALDDSLPVEAVSCGEPFLYVPLKNLAEIRSIRLRQDAWERVLNGFVTPNIFAFTREVENAGSTVHSRMFAPALGIAEDPATGGASGPLGCYLVRYGVVPSDGTGTAVMTSEQGIEMGRPSFIRIEIDHEGEKITGVRIAGRCVFMGEGELVL